MSRNANILVALLCLAMVPPLPVTKKRYQTVAAPTKGSGAMALIAPNLVIPPKPKTNNITITFSLTNNMMQVYPGIYVAYVSYLHRVCTNYAELQCKTSPAAAWATIGRTNRSPMKYQTANRFGLFRLRSYWE